MIRFNRKNVSVAYHIHLNALLSGEIYLFRAHLITATEPKVFVQILRVIKSEFHRIFQSSGHELDNGGNTYEGNAIPISQTCLDGICKKPDITLNDAHLGIIKDRRSGWKMDNAKDQKSIDAIGEEIVLWHE